MNIPVTHDGYVHVGQNNWASLEQIQQAVLQKQHPTLQANCQSGADDDVDRILREETAALVAAQRIRPRRAPEANAQQEHLPLPTMKFRNPNEARQESPTLQTLEDESEHLPLPMMNFRKR